MIKYRNLKRQKGFTLVELLVAIGITAIISVLISKLVVTGFNSSRFEVEQATAVENARDGLAVIKKELRGARLSERGDYYLQVINDENIVYFADIDDDGDAEKVRYYRSDRYLVREIVEPGTDNLYAGALATSSIASFLNNQEEDIFRYYDGNNNETTLINEIRLININLRINVTPEIAPNDYYVQSDVMIRNLKDNL